jgi:hypothetical protein
MYIHPTLNSAEFQPGGLQRPEMLLQSFLAVANQIRESPFRGDVVSNVNSQFYERNITIYEFCTNKKSFSVDIEKTKEVVRQSTVLSVFFCPFLFAVVRSSSESSSKNKTPYDYSPRS